MDYYQTLSKRSEGKFLKFVFFLNVACKIKSIPKFLNDIYCIHMSNYMEIRRNRLCNILLAEGRKSILRQAFCSGGTYKDGKSSPVPHDDSLVLSLEYGEQIEVMIPCRRAEAMARVNQVIASWRHLGDGTFCRCFFFFKFIEWKPAFAAYFFVSWPLSCNHLNVFCNNSNKTVLRIMTPVIVFVTVSGYFFLLIVTKF